MDMEQEKLHDDGNRSFVTRKLPGREEKITELREKPLDLHLRSRRVEPKVAVVNFNGSFQSFVHPTHLSTIFEGDDESGVSEKEALPFA